MHILMFADQHVQTLGGAQVSMRLQRRFLERAGHLVTIVAPALHGARAREWGTATDSGGDIDLPSLPITLDREYAMSWPGHRSDALIEERVAALPPVDVVHVQADFWGAFLGHRFSRRSGIPLVHTMHNRVDVGIEAVTPFPGVALAGLNSWQRMSLPALPGVPGGSDGWAYLRGLAAGAHAVTAPSSHFARRLEAHRVFPTVDVIWNGIDDDVLDAALNPTAEVGPPRSIGSGEDSWSRNDLTPADSPRAGRAPRFVWLGRMSPEKRLLPFLEAVADSGVRAEIEVIGGGAQLAAARGLVNKRAGAASVTFAGRLPYAETLRRIQSADAVVQTSIGFETQGMTVFEAASLGTPSIISDPDIGAELGSGFWSVGSGAADASVAALAATLRRAVTDIENGSAPVTDPDIREHFRQSSRTAAMVEVYRRAIG